MRVLGEAHPDTIWSMSDLGALHSVQQRFTEAESLLRRAHELRLQNDPGSFEVLNSELNLATTLFRMNRLEESEELLLRNIDGRAKMLGSQHPDSMLPIHRLGTLRMVQDRLVEADLAQVDVRDGAADRVLLVVGEDRRVNGLLACEDDVEDRVQTGRTGQRRPEIVLGNGDRTCVPLAVEHAGDQALRTQAPRLARPARVPLLHLQLEPVP